MKKVCKFGSLFLLVALVGFGLVACGPGADNDSGTGDYTPSGQTPTRPDGVTTLVLTVQGTSSIQLNWQAISGATSYRVYHGTASNSITNLLGSPTGTSYTHTGLNANTQHYYLVTAVNDVGEGHRSDSWSETARTAAVNLAAPANLNVTFTSATAVNLTWNSVSGATGYRVFRATRNTSTMNWNTALQVGGDISGTSYANTGLSPNTEYQYYVVAYTSGGNGTPSTSRNVRAPHTFTGATVIIGASVNNYQTYLFWIPANDSQAITISNVSNGQIYNIAWADATNQDQFGWLSSSANSLPRADVTIAVSGGNNYAANQHGSEGGTLLTGLNFHSITVSGGGASRTVTFANTLSTGGLYAVAIYRGN